jgi:hypothetical protein
MVSPQIAISDSTRVAADEIEEAPALEHQIGAGNAAP